MTMRDDHFRLLGARFVRRSDAVAEEVRRGAEDKYVIRTISYPQNECHSHLAVIRQYKMSLSELIRWLYEGRASVQSEQIIRIIPVTPQSEKHRRVISK